jgi:diguanylate cyclase (GGDEF)-like protein
MEAAAVHLKVLVADNPDQTPNVASLTARTQALIHDVQGLSDKGHPPIESLLRCRETLKLMTELERALLVQRTETSRRDYLVTLATEWAFVGLVLVKIVVLFGLIMRDALLRKKIARQFEASNRGRTEGVAALETSARQSHLLNSFSDELQLCVGVDQVYHSAAEYLARLIPGSSGSMCMINHSRNLVDVVSSWGSSSLSSGVSFSPEACCGLRLGQLRWRLAGQSEIDCTHFDAAAPARYLCVPMVAQGETLGVLYVECAAGEVHMEVEKHMTKMRQILQSTGMAVAALHLKTRLENQAIKDSLTGLFNRNFMEVVMQRELARAARMQNSLAVFMLDVDHFKRFNDTHGHAAGDAMLKAVAGVFQLNVRTEDTVCRYGGEEFAVILPGIPLEIAHLRAELIRHGVSQLRVPLPNGMCGEATISIGMAFYPKDAVTGETLMRRADEALYVAKRNGRNRICVAELPLAA